MKYIKLITVLLIAIVMASCGKAPADLTENRKAQTQSTPTQNVQVQNVQTQNISTLKDAINVSGLDILKSSVNADKSKNVIISPLSIFTSFSLLSNGAKGDTKDEIDKTFYLKKFGQQKLNEDMKNLISTIDSKNRIKEKSGFINVYNSVWFDNNFKISSSFLNTAKSYYNSEVFKKKLSDKSTVKDMNEWVNKKSSGLIKNPFESLSDEDRMVLVNLLNFKGKWVSSFDKANTKDEDFYLKDKKAVKVPLMNKEAMANYYEDSEAKACILDYCNGRMVVLLPNGNIDEYINSLTNEKINTYTEKALNSIVKLKMPKFKVEYKKDINDTLKSLGIIKTFEPGGADFSSLHEDSDSVWVGEVLHDCVIDVDEEGTSGAALTAEILCGTSLPTKTCEMYINKPFIFIIQDYSGINLFIGKIENVK